MFSDPATMKEENKGQRSLRALPLNLLFLSRDVCPLILQILSTACSMSECHLPSIERSLSFFLPSVSSHDCGRTASFSMVYAMFQSSL